ncbi:hypothetical protein Bca101_066365 [Brassica carinata]
MKLYSHCKLFAGFCEYEEEIKFSVTMSFVLDHMTTVFFLVHRITYLMIREMKEELVYHVSQKPHEEVGSDNEKCLGYFMFAYGKGGRVWC